LACCASSGSDCHVGDVRAEKLNESLEMPIFFMASLVVILANILARRCGRESPGVSVFGFWSALRRRMTTGGLKTTGG